MSREEDHNSWGFKGRPCSSMLGDINDDGLINVLDIVSLVNFVLGTDTPSNNEIYAADINGDGILNILDVVTMVNWILSD